jgi:hypothetical protein
MAETTWRDEGSLCPWDERKVSLRLWCRRCPLFADMTAATPEGRRIACAWKPGTAKAPVPMVFLNWDSSGVGRDYNHERPA